MAYGMGLTGEKVAAQWKVSREDQDAFALGSHQKACAAMAAGHFDAEITPYQVVTHLPGEAGAVRAAARRAEHDEGPRPATSSEARRVGKDGVRTCRSQLSPSPEKKNDINSQQHTS